MYFSKSYYDKFLIIVVLIVTVRALLTNKDEVDKREGRPWRLPNTSLPYHYDLHITTWIHQEILRFTGNVTIKVLVKAFTKELVLHTKNLDIQSIRMKDMAFNQTIRDWRSYFYDDLLVLTFKRVGDIFYPGQYVCLEILYSGVIKENDFGLQTLTHGSRDKRIYGVYSRLEPIYARTVLPCFDEPAFKANFSVRITHGRNVSAYSNTHVISTKENDAGDMITTTFKETPRMSTYLLSFVVSHFGIYSVLRDGIVHTMYRKRNATDRGELALINSIEAIKTFGRYMDMRYSLLKIDHAVVDFHNNAGWGLITYRENIFYGARPIFSQLKTQNHQIIHQWFGGLVSPMWWDSIWLSESLATYYSYKLTDMINPKFNARLKFQYENCNLNIWEPVIEYVEKPADIKRKYGNSTYKRAPCHLYLLTTIIGEKTFDDGVKDYLKSYAYSNANSDQFFQRIQNAVDYSREPILKINVSEMMKPYFTRSTYPQIVIFRNFSESNLLLIKQRSIGKFGGEIGESAELWPIPLGFAKETDVSPRYIPRVVYILRTRLTTLDLRNYNITLSKSEAVVVSIPGIENYLIHYRGK